MNMTENQIIIQGLENLKNTTGISGTWHKSSQSNEDGELVININDCELNMVVEIKNELRSHQLDNILKMDRKYPSFIVAATRIFPKIKEELRRLKISYIESNGNIYLNEKNIYIWIETQKPLVTGNEKVNRAFTKTGLKAVLLLIIDDGFINAPYRELSKWTQVSLGNITNIMNSLKETGFLTNLNSNQLRLTNTKELISKWASAYTEKLKPSIHLGNFSFLDKNDFSRWKNMSFNEDTVWGGEPAADIITEHLRPETLTIYTEESRTDFMKKYRLIPDEKGDVEFYMKFWKWNEHNELPTAPWLIVYAELMAKDDKRTRETAQMIYEKHVK